MREHEQAEEPQLKNRVTADLAARGAAYKVLLHRRAVYTVEDAAQERGVRANQVVKVMIVRGAAGFLAVLLPGDQRLSLGKLAKVVGETGLKLVSRTQIADVTGFSVGAVSPIGLSTAGLSVYVDQRLADQEMVTISSGEPEAGLALRAADLLAVVGGVLGDFSEDEQAVTQQKR